MSFDWGDPINLLQDFASPLFLHPGKTKSESIIWRFMFKAENLAFVSRTALWPAQKTWSKRLCSCRSFDLWRCGADAWTVWGAAGMRSLEIPVAHPHQASSQPLRSLMFSEKWQPMTTKEEEEKRKTASTASACKNLNVNYFFFLASMSPLLLVNIIIFIYLIFFPQWSACLHQLIAVQ